MGQIDNSQRNWNLNQNSANKKLQKSLNTNQISQTSPYISNSSSKARSKSIKNPILQKTENENQKCQSNDQNNHLQLLFQEPLQNNSDTFNKLKFSISDKKSPTSKQNHASYNLNCSSGVKGDQTGILGLRSSQKNPLTIPQYRIMVKPSTATHNVGQKISNKSQGNYSKGGNKQQTISSGQSGITQSSVGYCKTDISTKMKTEYNIYSDKLSKKIFDENNHFITLTDGSTKRKNSQVAFNTQASQKDINVQQSFDNNSFSQLFNSNANSLYASNSIMNQQANMQYSQNNTFYINGNTSNIQNTSFDIQNSNIKNNTHSNSNQAQISVFTDHNVDNIYSLANSTNIMEDIPIHDSQILNSFTKFTNIAQQNKSINSQNKPYLSAHSKQSSITLGPETTNQAGSNFINFCQNNLNLGFYGQTQSLKVSNCHNQNQTSNTQQNAQQQFKNNSVYFKMDNKNNCYTSQNTANHTHNHSSINYSNLQGASQSYKSSTKTSQKHSFSGPSSTNQKLNSILKISIQNGTKSGAQPGSPHIFTQNTFLNNKINYKKQQNKQKNLSYGSKLLQNFLNTQSIDNQSSIKNPISTPNRMNNSEMGYRDKVVKFLRGSSNHMVSKEQQLQIQQQQLQSNQSQQNNDKQINNSQRISHTFHTQMDTNSSLTCQENNQIIKTFSQPQLPPQLQAHQYVKFSDHPQVLKHQTKQDQSQEIQNPFQKDLQYVKEYKQIIQHNEMFITNIKHPYFSTSQSLSKQSTSEDATKPVIENIKQINEKNIEKPQKLLDWKQNMMEKLQQIQKSQASSQIHSNRDAKLNQLQSTVLSKHPQHEHNEAQDEYQLYKQRFLEFDQQNIQQQNQQKVSKQKQNAQSSQLSAILGSNQNYSFNKINFLKRNNI